MVRSPTQLLSTKRDGHEHEPGEITALIAAFLKGELADYQMSAWLMASYLKGLSARETVELTEAMLHSGVVLTHDGLDGPKVDKHSTGGVGDKISLPLAPLVAECGLVVPMISGRGLGHTGGTLDKLESVPGYDVRPTARRFSAILRKVGCSIIGQTEKIAPADRRIYALRDVTATVACRPLIVASILSKKLAAGLDGLVLDVKTGRGAFMKTEAEARALAKDLVAVAEALGTPTLALLTRMDAPLGRTIGNALEVRESIEILRGEGPRDTTELTLALGAEMLVLGGVEPTRQAARKRLTSALASGRALVRFSRMLEAHGGDPRVVDEPKRLGLAPSRVVVEAENGGFVRSLDSLCLAEIALELGAGRARAEDAVDPLVGIELHVAAGDEVERGAPLMTLHARKKVPELRARALASVELGPRRPKERPLILGRLGHKSARPQRTR